MLGAGRADTLDDQVELVRVLRPEVVVVDRRAQELAGAGAQRLERERRQARRRQRQGRRPAAVDDPHDARVAAAILEEELLDGVGQRARLPQATERRLEVRKAVNGDGAIDGSAQRAADEGDSRTRDTGDGIASTDFLSDVNAGCKSFPQPGCPPHFPTG